MKYLMQLSTWRKSLFLQKQMQILASSLSTTTQLSNESEKIKPLNKRWKESADVVVMGGGVVGTSLAYHLAKAGIKDVVLLEKSELTAGSTWHAAGLTTYYHPGINVKQLHYYSLNLYKTLEEETGQDVGFHTPGSIRLATTTERVNEFLHQISRNNWNPQIGMKLMTPDEVEEACPVIAKGKILAGLYTHEDGHIDPYSLTQALAIGARKYGAEIYQGAPVTATTQKSDGTWDVTTPHGTISATHIINAAGFWSRELAKLAGIDMPTCAIHHQYCVTSTIPEVQELKTEIPVMRDLDGSYYLRQEKQGLLFGPYEEEHMMDICDDWYYNGVTAGFGKELFQPNLDRIMKHIEFAMEMFPALGAAEITQTVSGPITYTPDVLPMVGPYQGLHNYWCAVGFGYGIVHAGGVGKYLTDWIVKGYPSYDLIELDPNRYSNTWCSDKYVVDKCRESYGHNNAIGVPKEERFTGRPTSRITQIYEQQIQRGAEMSFHSGWEQPLWFALPGDTAGYFPSFRRTNWWKPVGRECEMVMNRGGIIDVTPFGKFDISGPDAYAFMDRLCANVMPKVGKSNISHMLTEIGRVYAELTITQYSPCRFLAITGSGSELHDLRWMEERNFEWNYDVEIKNVTDDLAVLSVAGPLSREVLSKVTDVDLSDDAYPFLSMKSIQIAGVDVDALRISYTGELGWEIYIPKDRMSDVYNSLIEAGKPLGVGDFGTLAMNAMRLEHGFRGWGAEMTTDSHPYEAGLGFFVKPNKEADFVGKEAVKAIKAQGWERQLVFMNVESDVDPEGNHAIWYDGKVVGMTTSGAYGYIVGSSIAFGYVPIELAVPGSTVHVEMLGKMYPSIVQKSAPILVESVRARRLKKQAESLKAASASH